MGKELSSKRDEAIIKLLNLKDYTKKEIHERLSKELRYKGKSWDIQLSKKLHSLIKEKEIELSSDSSRYPKYTAKKNPNSIAQADGALFNLNMGEFLLRNHESVFFDISRSRKNHKSNLDQEYTKNLIELLGIYLFSMLVRSYDVPCVIKGKNVKKSRDKKKTIANKKEFEELRSSWLSKALSLEEGWLKTSRLFDSLIHEFAKFDNNGKYNEKVKPTKESWNNTRIKMAQSFEKLYPYTNKNILKVMDKSDEVLISLKKKANEDPISDDLLEILTKK